MAPKILEYPAEKIVQDTPLLRPISYLKVQETTTSLLYDIWRDNGLIWSLREISHPTSYYDVEPKRAKFVQYVRYRTNFAHQFIFDIEQKMKI